MCSSFFQSLSEAPPREFLFCLTRRLRGCAASFCTACFSNNVPISESWRKERAEKGEKIKRKQGCESAFDWRGGRVLTSVNKPHCPLQDEHGVEETPHHVWCGLPSHSQWARAPPHSGVMWGHPKGTQARGLWPRRWSCVGCAHWSANTQLQG